MVGPKLLSAFGNAVGFERIASVGALSPEVLADLAAGGGEALERLRGVSPPLAGANLCASLCDPTAGETLLAAIRHLLREGW